MLVPALNPTTFALTPDVEPVIVTGEVSELGDADLTKLVTDLQATIVNRDAAQAAFVKIGQQSLFDFLK